MAVTSKNATSCVSTYLGWLSDRQAAYALQPDTDPASNYRALLEARIATQSAHIEALQQMLRSEHDRHLTTSRETDETRTPDGITQAPGEQDQPR